MADQRNSRTQSWSSGGERRGQERRRPGGGRDRRYGDNDDDNGGGGDGGGRRRFSKRRKTCKFCVEKIPSVDYKKGDMLRRFLTDRGKIRPRRQTGVCAKHQRQLATAIKRARHLALLPFVVELGPRR